MRDLAHICIISVQKTLTHRLTHHFLRFLSWPSSYSPQPLHRPWGSPPGWWQHLPRHCWIGRGRGSDDPVAKWWAPWGRAHLSSRLCRCGEPHIWWGYWTGSSSHAWSGSPIPGQGTQLTWSTWGPLIGDDHRRWCGTRPMGLDDHLIVWRCWRPTRILLRLRVVGQTTWTQGFILVWATGV
jgi:hypothetical protein